MARKSAFENLQSKLEDGADSGDTNIDITVIADSDGEAGETVADAIEVGEDIAEGEAIAAADDDAQQEAEDLTQMAVILREHGLNAGMAAIMQAYVPLDTYGITLPAFETLDAAGRNQAAADRLAAAFEAKAEGFWANTKNVFKKIWQWLRDMYTKVITMLGSLKGRIERMGEALSKRVYDEARNKDSKMPLWKQHKATSKFSKGMEVLIADLDDASKIVSAKSMSTALSEKAAGDDFDAKKSAKAFQGAFKNADIAACGLKWKESDSLTLESVGSDFFSTEETTITKKSWEDYKKGGIAFLDAANTCDLANGKLPNLKKYAEDQLKAWESENIGLTGVDKNSDEETKKKSLLSNAKALVKAYQKLVSACIKCMNFNCTNYLKCGRKILSHTKATGDSGADYSE